MTSTGRRVGRDTLLEAALTLLDGVTLHETTSAIGTRSVAEQAGVSPSTVSHHFSSRDDRAHNHRTLAQAVIERALEAGRDITTATRADLNDISVMAATTTDAVSVSIEDAERIAAANLEAWLAPERRVSVTARHLAYAAAANDPEARRLLDARDRQLRDRLAPAYGAFLNAFGRQWVDGWDEQRFMVVTSSMADGFVMRHRFDPDLAPVALFGEAVGQLLQAVTEERTDIGGAVGGVARVPLPARSTLDPHKRDAIASAAGRIYDAHGWPNVTVAAVATEAGVSRATVNAHFHRRIGLAAPIFGRCLEPLDAAIRSDRSSPLTAVIRNHLERLASYGQHHLDVTSAFLASHHEQGYSGRDANGQTPSPVFVVPIHELVAGLVEREPERFRPGVVDSPIGLVQFSIFLTRSCLSLATGRPEAAPSELADFLHDTVVAGALVRRPSLRRG